MITLDGVRSNRNRICLSFEGSKPFACAAKAQYISPQFVGKFTLTSTVQWGKGALPPGNYTLRINSISSPIMVSVLNDRDTLVATVMTRSIADYTRGPNALQLKTRNGQAVVQSLVLADLNMVLTFEPSPAHEKVKEARADSSVVLVARK